MRNLSPLLMTVLLFAFVVVFCNQAVAFAEQNDGNDCKTAEENNPPVISAIADVSVNEEESIDFTILWNDPDAEDTLVVSISNIPSGANFDTTTGRFTWIPTKLQEGDYNGITVYVSDGYAVAQESFNIKVNDPVAPLVTTSESLDTDSSGGIDLVKVYFDEVIVLELGFTPSSFSVNGISSSSYSMPDQYSLELVFGDEIPTTSPVILKYSPQAGSIVTDTVSNQLAMFEITAQDMAPPVVLIANAIDNNGDGHPNMVVLAFSEPLASSASTLDGWRIFDSSGQIDLLGDHSGVSVVLLGSSLTFYLPGGKGSAGTPVYSYTGTAIADDAGNIANISSNNPPTVTTASVINNMPPSMVSLDCNAADADQSAESLTYRWIQTGGPVPVMLTASNTKTAEGVFTFIGAYTFVVTVTDSFGDRANAGLTVNIVNVPPVAMLRGNYFINRIRTPNTVLDSSLSFDPNGGVLTYKWVAPAQLALSQDDISDPTITPTTDGVFALTLTVTDADNTPSSTTVNIVVFSDTNVPPSANAGPDQIGEVGKIIVLDGRASVDPDGNPLTFVWTRISGPTAALQNAGSSISGFMPNTAGRYVFALTVNDGNTDGLPDTVAVTILSNTTNNPPVAITSGEETVPFVPSFMLDGSTSSDPDGDAITFSWTLLEGAGQLSNATTANADFKPYRPGSYRFQLIVNDSRDASLPVEKTVHFTTQGFSPPVLDIGYLSIPAIPEIPVTVYFINNSEDADGEYPAFFYEIIGGPIVDFVQDGYEPYFSPNLPCIHKFRCTAFDGIFRVSVEVSIPVTSTINPLPKAIANRDKTAFVGHPTNLDFSDEYKWTGGNVLWVQISGPTLARLTDAYSKLTTFTPPVEGEYTFALYVYRDMLWSEPDTVVVTAIRGHPKISSGCFIATASFGSASSDAVKALCNIRDRSLVNSLSAKSLTNLYYLVSPFAAEKMIDSGASRALLRRLLLP